MKPWQKGYPLEKLKALTAVFRAFDGELAQGAFVRVREVAVADWLARGQLRGWDGEKEVLDPGQRPARAFCVRREIKHAPKRIFDFASYTIGFYSSGDVVVNRCACLPGKQADLLALLRQQIPPAPGRLWLLGWQEHPAFRNCVEALGAKWCGSKILASGEIIGVWGVGEVGPGDPLFAMHSAEENATLRRLLAVPPAALRQAVSAIEKVGPQMLPHYSSYNKRGSWWAVALRGYGGREDFIEKPAEMSRAWKLENAEKLHWSISDTPLRKKLKELEPLIEAVPGVKHRIRLMRLVAGGGELGRHADITDPHAGAIPGKLMRVHIPLFTNSEVFFTSWNLMGEELSCHMAEGEVWYLDTRKPHTARNVGKTDRVHLVMDVVSNESLLALVRAGKEAKKL